MDTFETHKEAFSFQIALNSLAVGFWLWMAYHQLTSAISMANPVPLLLGIQSVAVGIFLLLRKGKVRINACPWYLRLFILAMALLGPVAVDVQNPSSLPVIALSCAGLALTLWALFTLGRSFGVSPADRGLVIKGPYRFIRHPMYTGELLNMAAVVAGNLSWWNVTLLLVSSTVIVYRIHLEEGILGGYSDYSSQVRWRILPFIW